MQRTCPRCGRSWEYADEPPDFCAKCGERFDGPMLSTVTAEAGSETGSFEHDPGRGPVGPVPTRIAGYSLLRPIGQGGMGTVFEAESEVDGRRVALKLIRNVYAATSEEVQRFRQEGRLAGTLAHPRCVFVLAADEEAGRPYIAMELMPGRTLKDLVRDRGPLEPEAAVRAVLDVIDGLIEAHRAGILHRDVKPSNCFVGADGRVKIGDFGLSRTLNADHDLTQTGRFLGTPLFASPEQVRRDPLDVRTDVYSVAATLYFLLAGRAPFERAGVDAQGVMARIVADDPPPLRSVRRSLPAGLERVVLRGLERDRDRRWSDLDEFRRALRPFLPGELGLVGLGIRSLAFVLDVALVIVPLVVVLGLIQAARTPQQAIPAGGWRGVDQSEVARLIATIPVFVLAYFIAGDGVFGGTPGKRVFRLRVYAPARAGAPGPGRGVVRTLVYFGLTSLHHPLLWALDPPPLVCLLIDALRGPVLLSLLFCTARRRNGYRGLHDLASGTRVVRRPDVPPPRSGWVNRDDSDDVRPAGAGDRVGPYTVVGVLSRRDRLTVLRGEDRALDRSVWIAVRPSSTPPPSPARQAAGRPTRPRWINGGESAAGRWDAYPAARGCPLTALIARRGPPDWRDLRRLLEGLADELAAARDENTLPESLSLAQVWVLADGGPQLIDVPAGGVDQPQAGSPLDLLRQVAAACDAPPAGSRPPPPRHARRILGRIADPDRGYRTLDQARDDLRATADRPTGLTPAQKVASLGVLVALAFGVVSGPIFVFGALPRSWAVGRGFGWVWFMQIHALLGFPACALAWAAWAFLTRGGFTRRWLGIALTGPDGGPPPRVRCAVREACLWALVSTAVSGPYWVEVLRPGLLNFLLWVAIPSALLFAQVHHARTHPGRWIHDRLAGTYLVPE